MGHVDYVVDENNWQFWTIIGLVCGVPTLILVVVIVVCCVRMRNKNKKKLERQETDRQREEEERKVKRTLESKAMPELKKDRETSYEF